MRRSELDIRNDLRLNLSVVVQSLSYVELWRTIWKDVVRLRLYRLTDNSASLTIHTPGLLSRVRSLDSAERSDQDSDDAVDAWTTLRFRSLTSMTVDRGPQRVVLQ